MIRGTGLELVAVTYDPGKEIPYYEKTDCFELYYVSGKKIKHGHILSVYPKEKSQLTASLRDAHVKCVIARGYGPRAMHELQESGIEAYTFTGGTNAAIKAFAKGELQSI